MTNNELFDKVIEKAKIFGFSPRNIEGMPDNPYGNAVIRKNISEDAFTKGGAYFGIIHPKQNTNSSYSDYSFVVFPDKCLEAVVVGLVIGSHGFENDYELSALPGLRRQFLKLHTNTEKSFFKDDFQDKESTFSRLLKYVRLNYPNLAKSVDNYKTVIVACEIVDFPTDESSPDKALQRIYAWLASYALIREIGNKDQIKAQNEAIPTPQPAQNDRDRLTNLLEMRKYIVLQGAPGTGKTYTALQIATDYDKVFFEQFHAETTYSDFIGGFQPAVDPKAETDFIVKDGVLTQAIKYANSNSNERVLLIIDEINRANLSNVLGPVFYLFEPSASHARNVTIKVNGTEINALPDNIHVIATMNTADRSLAVVDFALRRRFAWYTLRPRILQKSERGGKTFDEKLFNEINDIFLKYATDSELSLQPGHSYFIFDKDDATIKRNKIEFELMPLIKEYLTEGYLSKARTAFSELFLQHGCRMYE